MSREIFEEMFIVTKNRELSLVYSEVGNIALRDAVSQMNVCQYGVGNIALRDAVSQMNVCQLFAK